MAKIIVNNMLPKNVGQPAELAICHPNPANTPSTKRYRNDDETIKNNNDAMRAIVHLSLFVNMRSHLIISLSFPSGCVNIFWISLSKSLELIYNY